jgi:uncharacterized protein YqeY
MAAIGEKLGKDIILAMKAREEHTLTTLRMVKAALKSKEIDKREPLDDAEEQAVLTTMLKQRRDSFEQFTKGGRPELAAKEQTEMVLIDAYLPQAAGEDEIRTIVHGAIEHLKAGNGGAEVGPKDMGPLMRVIKQRLLSNGIRADGQKVSEMVKAELGGGQARVG